MLRKGCQVLCWVWSSLFCVVALANVTPQTYTVQDGDTLWDIADRFLDEPWRWREIWQASPNIQNPDLIYPGDVVTLSTDESGQIVIKVVRNEPSNGNHKRYMPNGVVKLSPKVRSMPADKAIPTLPIDVIGPFLNASQVVSQGAYLNAPKIVALEEEHLMIGPNSKMYIDGLPYNDVISYSVYRKGKIYTHPKTEQVLGMEAEVLGLADLLVRGIPATMQVTKSYAEIKLGDRVMPHVESELLPYFTPKKPKSRALGYIISVFGGLNQIGQFQVVTITGGKDIGRESGDVLLVYQTQTDVQKRFAIQEKPLDVPPDYIGQVMVFRVFDKVSFGLVMKAFRTIYLHDEVRSP